MLDESTPPPDRFIPKRPDITNLEMILLNDSSASELDPPVHKAYRH